MYSVATLFPMEKAPQRISSTSFLEMLLIFLLCAVPTTDFNFTWISELSSFLLILMIGEFFYADVLRI